MNNDRNGQNEPMYSECVKAGKRYYYIDVKKDSNGSYYIVLTESKATTEGTNKQRHRIFLYQEDFEKFSVALNNAMAYAQNENDSDVEDSSSIDSLWADVEKEIEIKE